MTKTRNTPARTSRGRFKPDHNARNAAVGVTALLGVAAAGLAAAFRFGFLDRFLPAKVGHAAPDLALDLPRPGADARAPAAFRPDMAAPMTAAEKEALRPPAGQAATGVFENV